MPTADKFEKFYEHLTFALRMTSKHEVTIVLGDFNAKVVEQ